MKEKYRLRLIEDFNKYTKQIGILDEEKPALIVDKKTMDEVKSTWPINNQSRMSTSRYYGICYWEQRTIYVNLNKRIANYKTYKGAKYSRHYLTKHKKTYRDYLHTLVHELVHYRFKSLSHGKEYEKRITDILHGKVWPEKVLYDKNTTQLPDKNITIPTPVVEPVTTPIVEAVPDLTDWKKMYFDLSKQHKEVLNQLSRIRSELGIILG
jgi:hypothetical protein